MTVPGIIMAAILLLCLHAPPARGQSGGSVYSRFGVGALKYTSSARHWSMGGSSAAVLSSSGINDVNPAAWTAVDKVRFSAGALYEGLSMDDGSSTRFAAGTRFNGLALAVPLYVPGGLTLGAGVVPMSRVDYAVVAPESQAGLDYTMEYRGEGGISRAFTGISWRITEGLHAGAAFNYFFGSTRISMNQTFGNSSYAGTEYTRNGSIRGIGSTWGLVYDRLGEVLSLPEGGHLAAGIAFTAASYPRIEYERIYTYGAAISSAPPDTLAAGESKFRLPLSVTGGLGYGTDNMEFAADVRYQDWSGTVIEGTGGAELRRSIRVSLGAEFNPGRRPTDLITRTPTYRFGVYRDGGYLTLNGERIAENGITAGISFSLLNETRLTLAAGFAMRGTNDAGLQSENIYRVSASLDVVELWFQRPTEE